MKKVLLGSTALVAAGMVAGIGAPAQAAEPIQLSLGGYYQAFFTMRAQSDVDRFGVAGNQHSTFGNDEEISHTDVQQEGEIFFVGETTLDNGIKVGVNVQLEAYQSGDQIDEHYVYFSGNFGRLVVGAENSAPYVMQYTAPNAVAGHGIDSPNHATLAGAGANSVGGGAVSTYTAWVSDANKITYFTPRFSPGFQFGFSYTPEVGGDISAGGTSNPVSDNEDNVQHNVLSFGVNFVRTFGSVDFAWSFGYEHGFHQGNGVGGGVIGANCNQPGNPASVRVCIPDPDNMQGRDSLVSGFNIGIGGWTVGASFKYDDEGQERDNAEMAIAAGVTYGAGPWLVGLQMGYGVDQDGDNFTNCSAAIHQAALVSQLPINGSNNGCTRDADQALAAEIGGTYTLGPGVRVAAGLIGWHMWGDDGNENMDGLAFTMGTALSF